MNAPDLIIHICEGAVIAAGLLLAKITISGLIETIQARFGFRFPSFNPAQESDKNKSRRTPMAK